MHLFVIALAATFALPACKSLLGGESDESTPAPSPTIAPPGPPAQVDLNGPSGAAAGECSAAFTVTTRDSAKKLAGSPRDTEIKLEASGAGASGLSFYPDRSCSSIAVTALTLKAGGNYGTFHALGKIAAPTVVKATGPMGLATAPFVVAAASSRAFKIAGPASATAGSCASAFTLTSQDGAGNAVAPKAALLVTLSGTGSGAVFVDSSCTTVFEAGVLTLSASEASFYVKDTRAESLTLQASAGGYASASHAFSSAADKVSKLTLEGPGSAIAAACGSAYTLTARDANGNAVAGDALALTMGGLGSGGWYADSACATPSSPSIPSGGSAVALYFKDTKAESITLSAAASGLSAGSVAVSISPAQAALIQLVGPGSATAGTCTAAFTATARDASGNAAPLVSALIFSFGGAGSGGFYSDAACTNQIGSASVAAGASATSFYFKDSLVETLTLSASANGVTSGTSAFAVLGGPPASLALGGAGAGTAGTCSGALTVTVRDSQGNAVSPTSSLTVSLAGAGSGTLYADSGCTSAASTLAVSTSTGVFYAKDTLAETLTLGASASGVSSASRTLAVVAASPSQIAPSGPASGTAGGCAGLFTLAIRDAYGNAAPGTSSRTVSLGGGGFGKFYSDSGCASEITSILYLVGDTAKTYYFRDTSAEALTLTGSSAGLTASSASFSLAADSPAQVVLTGAATAAAGSCGGYVATIRDPFGNARSSGSSRGVTISGGGLGASYADSGCATGATAVTLGAGDVTQSFYFKDTNAQATALTIASGGLTGSSLSISVAAASPAQIAITGPAVAKTGTCVPYQTATRDAYGNSSPLGSQTPFTLTGASAKFHADAACATPALTALTYASGASAAAFYLKDTAIEALTISADDGTGGLPTGTLPLSTESRRDLGASYRDNCIQTAANDLKCWGESTNGRLGYGDTIHRGDNPGELGANLSLVNLEPGAKTLRLVNSYSAKYAILDNGKLKAWGPNGFGQLGLGDVISRGDAVSEMGSSLPTVDVGTNRTVVDVSASFNHACAILDDLRVRCWGSNAYGGLGTGDVVQRGDGAGEMGNNLLVANLGTNRTARQLATGSEHSCAITDLGEIKCWGRNFVGQLGDGTNGHKGDAPGEMGDNRPAVNLGTSLAVREVVAGHYNSCAIFENGALKCWGYNLDGQLGIGTNVDAASPPGSFVDLGVNRSVSALSIGISAACAILDTNQVKCWGDNAFGQLGQGDVLDRGDQAGEMGASLPVVDLGAGRSARAISMSNQHACAMLDDLTYRCWGLNDLGQLGLGDNLNRGDQAGEMGAALPATAP